ncbi:hypothetical protein BHE74_00046875 [Ensete ventricosum]|nr:hypothetical protein BHE74_00046875 [Ensete ventricosum]RZS07015.1 hypothetical protein BHM03_00037776 [Ensete ventricosum]
MTKSKGKPKAPVPMNPKMKPKLANVRPKRAATRSMPKVPIRSTKAVKTFTKEERWSPRMPLRWRPNSNPNSPGADGYHRLCYPFSTVHAAICVEEEGDHGWKITTESRGATGGANEIEREGCQTNGGQGGMRKERTTTWAPT